MVLWSERGPGTGSRYRGASSGGRKKGIVHGRHGLDLCDGDDDSSNCAKKKGGDNSRSESSNFVTGAFTPLSFACKVKSHGKVPSAYWMNKLDRCIKIIAKAEEEAMKRKIGDDECTAASAAPLKSSYALPPASSG